MELRLREGVIVGNRTTRGTVLRSDTTEEQFIQNRKPPSAAAESCHRVALTLRDGSAIYAFVKLRK